MAFPCPECGSRGTRVSNTEQRGYRIKRYIRCEDCGVRFRTIERHASPKKPGTPNRPKPSSRTYNRGEGNPAAVLAAADVLAIRQAIEAGSSQAELARRYGLSSSHVSRIANRQIWRNL